MSIKYNQELMNMQRNQLLAQASVDDLKRGYVFDVTQDRFLCLCCGFKTEPGQIYRSADAYYDAEKFTASTSILNTAQHYKFCCNSTSAGPA